MNATAAIVFTLDELWFLQSLVRHEIPDPPTWKFPPASLELNDAIADAILSCADYGLREVALQLSRGDLLLLDYQVPQSAKDIAGKDIGKTILLKTFRARRLIAEGVMPAAPETDETAASVRLELWKGAGMPKHPRRSRKLQKEE